MVTYLDKVRFLYPTIQHVMYWCTKPDCTPWNDPYEGLLWENKDIEKPSKEQLDAIPEEEVLYFLEKEKKLHRNNEHSKSLVMIGLYESKKKELPELTFSDFLDELEVKQKDLLM